MAEALKTKKERVVADLEQKSASITNRIGAIESALPVAPKKVRDLVGKRSVAKIGIAVVAGSIVGAILLRSKRGAGTGFRQELDDISGSIGKEIRKNLSKGMDADDAVERALRKRPPLVQLGGDSSVLGGAVSQLVRQVASVLGPIIAEKLADRIRTHPDEK